MKLSKQIDRTTLLSEIFHCFKDEFQKKMNQELGQGIDPAGTGRIDIELVLNALENTKGLLAKHFECREVMLKARAKPIAGTTWETKSIKRHGWKMLEYMLDFSISYGAIPVVIGRANEPAFQEGDKFELLLGAESEMGTRMEIARDLLKLLDVKCRVKILLYEARVNDGEVNKVKRTLEAVLNRHASNPMNDFWIFIGIPRYSRWYEYQEKRAQTPRKVYFLEEQEASLILKDKTEDLWKL